MGIGILVFMFLLSIVESVIGKPYYVKQSGNDAKDGLSYATAKATLNSVISSYALVGGDVIYLDGVIGHTTTPKFTSADKGSKIHPTSGYTEVITLLSGSTVTFSTTPSGVSTTTDYVCIFNSFAGNAGIFKVSSVAGANITVDTSVLPGGTFFTERTNPWGLIGAIIRPIVITSYNPAAQAQINGTARISTNDGLKFDDTGYILVDNVEIYDNGRLNVFVDGGCYFIAFSNCYMHKSQYNLTTVRHEETLADTKYIVFQHNKFNESGLNTINEIGEFWYAGHATDERYVQDYQVYAYNEADFSTGGSSSAAKLGGAYNGKINSHYCIVWGNYLHGWNALYKTNYGGIKCGKGPHVIANNYIAGDYAPAAGMGGIVLMSLFATTNDHYIFNNIICSGGGNGYGMIYVEGGNYANTRVYNNTLYAAATTNGIHVNGYTNAGHLGYVYNNIIHSAHTGLKHGTGGSGGVIDNHDYNIVYNSSYANFVGAVKQANEYTTDPGLTNPAKGNFTLGVSSNAGSKGLNLSKYFVVDKHDALDLRTIGRVKPVLRSADVWDIGAYQYSLEPVKNLRVVAP